MVLLRGCRAAGHSTVECELLAAGDLVFVGGERCQDFALLALWHVEEVQSPTEFRRDLIKFCGGIRRSR
jgi:hypothetical protein